MKEIRDKLKIHLHHTKLLHNKTSPHRKLYEARTILKKYLEDAHDKVYDQLVMSWDEGSNFYRKDFDHEDLSMRQLFTEAQTPGLFNPASILAKMDRHFESIKALLAPERLLRPFRMKRGSDSDSE